MQRNNLSSNLSIPSYYVKLWLPAMTQKAVHRRRKLSPRKLCHDEDIYWELIQIKYWYGSMEYFELFSYNFLYFLPLYLSYFLLSSSLFFQSSQNFSIVFCSNSLYLSFNLILFILSQVNFSWSCDNGLKYLLETPHLRPYLRC